MENKKPEARKLKKKSMTSGGISLKGGGDVDGAGPES